MCHGCVKGISYPTCYLLRGSCVSAVRVIAGEAAWRVGKHSRHLEVLKENMRWLSLEVGLTRKAEELLCLSLAAENELHSTQGYSPINGVLVKTSLGFSLAYKTAATCQHIVTVNARPSRSLSSELRQPAEPSSKPIPGIGSEEQLVAGTRKTCTSRQDSWCTSIGKK